MPSNFQTGGAGDVTYTVGDDATGVLRCTTTGYAFITHLQTVVGVTSDGRFGYNTYTRLLAALTASGQPTGQAISAALGAFDGGARALRTGAVIPAQFAVALIKGAIWLFTWNEHGVDIQPSQIVLPADTVFPKWATSPAVPSDMGFYCEGDIHAASSVPVAPAPANNADATGDTGVPSDTSWLPGSTPAPYTGATPTGVPPPGAPPVQSGVSAGVVIAGVAILAVVGVVGWSLTRGTGRAAGGRRAAPARARRGARRRR